MGVNITQEKNTMMTTDQFSSVVCFVFRFALLCIAQARAHCAAVCRSVVVFLIIFLVS